MSSAYSTPAAAGGASSGSDREPNVIRMLTRLAWQTAAVTGVVSIVLGVIVLAWPHATLLVVGVLFGLYLLVSGILHIVGAFGPHVPASLRAIGLVTGALSILLGLICFRRPAESILLLALWIGFGWLMRGIGHTVTVASAPPFDGRGWLIAAGVITIIAGVVVIVSPITSIATLTLLAGIWLIVVGVSDLAEAFRLRRMAGR